MDDKGMRESERVSVSPAREVDSSGLLLTIMVLMFAVGIPALLYGLVNGLGMRGRPLTHGSMVEGIVYTLSLALVALIIEIV